MDRAAELPDRCIACNRPAGGYRLRRKLYYSPPAWKIGASLAPFLILLAGAWLELWFLAGAFWPLVIVLVIANVFVRKSLKLQIGVCPRHRDLRVILVTLSWACVAGVFVGMYGTPLLILGSLAALLALLGVQSFAGVQPLRLSALSAEHAWLAGTGRPFREALPELA